MSRSSNLATCLAPQLDLATYRNSVRIGNGNVLRNYNEEGATNPTNPGELLKTSGWCVETDLDIEMVSVSCPQMYDLPHRGR